MRCERVLFNEMLSVMRCERVLFNEMLSVKMFNEMYSVKIGVMQQQVDK